MNNFKEIIKNIFAPGSKRELEHTFTDKIISLFTVAIAIYHLYTLGIWRSYTTEIHSFIHLSSLLILVFLTHSYSNQKSFKIPAIDLIFIFLGLATIFYFITKIEDRLIGAPIYRPISNLEFLAGVIFLFLVFEGARRVVGIPFLIVIFFFILIMGIGTYLPGKFAFQNIPLNQIIEMIVWSPVEGLWGIPLRVSATVIIMFFIFGKIMEKAGIGTLLISLCNLIAGRTRGGPAKVAVIGSGLVGSVTGGPASNIVMTGTFTIPMMKRVGFKPYYAGAVECAASTGASIVPPVMTGVVFVMAALTGIPYAKIMITALLPAFLYYLGILLQVHFQAIKLNISGYTYERNSNDGILSLLKEQGHLLLPIFFLTALLLWGYTPVMAAFLSTLSVIIVTAFRKKTRMGLKQILISLDEAIREATTIALILSLSGIILISLFTTGLAGMFTHTVSVIAGGSLLLLGFIGSISSLIIGMIGPIIGSYLITTLIVVPAMVKEGLPLMVAHFFCLYFANISFITPPVAIGAFVAASIAKANFWHIGFTALRLSFASCLVPFVFIYRPALLLHGDLISILEAFIYGILIIICFASAFEGWFFTKLDFFQRILLISSGLGFMSINTFFNILSVISLGIVLIWQMIQKGHKMRNYLIQP